MTLLSNPKIWSARLLAHLDKTFVYGAVRDGGLTGTDGDAVTLTAKSSRDVPARMGQEARLVVRDDATVHLFHTRTGERIGD